MRRWLCSDAVATREKAGLVTEGGGEDEVVRLRTEEELNVVVIVY